jgi:hypothetical protein
MSTRPSADVSFVNGLLFGTLVGAAAVVLLSPEVRSRVRDLSAAWGLPADPTPVQLVEADRARDQVLGAVAPPPDPLGAPADGS